MPLLDRQRLRNVASTGGALDTFVLANIALQAIAMAFTDYRLIHVDDHYNPSSEHSVRNRVIAMAEYYFIVVFVIELLIKAVAFGLIGYLRRSRWNQMDACIVLVSFLSLLRLPTAIPNMSVVRTMRVLRPLRAISKLSGLRRIVESLSRSANDLLNVMVLLFFVLAVFSVVGLLFMRGLFHARCRIAPFPIKMPADCRNVHDHCWETFLEEIIVDPEPYRCDEAQADYVESPQDCIWPIDHVDERVCSLSDRNANGGCNTCPPRPVDDANSTSSPFLYRTCGSNYDAYGNPRFISSLEPYGYDRMRSGSFVEALNWGLTNYDDFASAIVTSFQVVTQEGWTAVMNMSVDAWAINTSIFLYTLLVVVGGLVILNLVLAVISSSLNDLDACDVCTLKEERMNMTLRIPEERTDDSDGTVGDDNINKKAWRQIVQTIVGSNYYSRYIFSCIVLNTIVLCFDHHGISMKHLKLLERGNAVFAGIFLVDVVLMNLSMGIRSFWKDKFCCFDGIIGILSIVELITEWARGSNNSTGPSSFSVLRSLRVLRLFKMARKWKTMQILLGAMMTTMQEIGNFALLLLVLIFVYSLVGQQLFANKMRFDPSTGMRLGLSDPGHTATSDIPRSNYDTMPLSMITTFQVLTGEDWNSVMYNGWRATSFSWVAVLYFISLVVIGNFVVMNLFLGILISNVEASTTGLGDGFSNASTRDCECSPVGASRLDEKLTTHSISPLALGVTKFANTLQRLHAGMEWTRFCSRHFKAIRGGCWKLVEHRHFDPVVTFLIITSSISLALDDPLSDPQSTLPKILKAIDLFFTFAFSVECSLKILAQGLVLEKNSYLRDPWNHIDFCVVLVSIFNLANIGPGSTLRVLRILRVLRPLRMIKRLPQLKVVVDALLLSIPSAANVALLCIVFFLVFSLLGVSLLKGSFYHCSGDAFDALTSLQKRLVENPTSWDQLQEQRAWFNANVGWNSSPLEEHCLVDIWANSPSLVPTSKQICDCLAPGHWRPVIPQNFDNVVNGMALLFEISTTEGWMEVMHAAIDQRGPENQPIRDNNLLWALFFIGFLLIGSYFVLEAFVAVTVHAFQQLRDTNGTGIMTQAQKEWALTQAFVMRQVRPERRMKRPSAPLRAKAYDFVMPSTNPRFDRSIATCIFLNFVVVASTTFGESHRKAEVLESLNLFFTFVFTVEAGLKVYALGKQYFRSKWNCFDCIIVCGSVLGILMNAFVPSASAVITLIQACRVLRLVRLVRSIRGLRVLFNALLSSLPSIANIGGLIGLIIFIYATVGRQLFSFLPDGDGGIGHTANFRSVRNAIMLLLRFATGEAWNTMMHSMMTDSSGGSCDLNPTFNPDAPWCQTTEDLPKCTLINGCPAGKFTTYIYFYSFTLLVGYIILNLFVAAVLESFDNSKESDILSSQDLDSFLRLWSLYDENATWYIDAALVTEMIARLGKPLGFGFQVEAINSTDDGQIMKDIESLMQESGLADIPVNKDGKCNIVPVACMLGKSSPYMYLGTEYIVGKIIHCSHSSTFPLPNHVPIPFQCIIVNDSKIKTLARRLAMLKQGADFNELCQSNPLQQKLSIHKQNGIALRDSVFFGTLPSTKLRALQTFARAYRQKRQQNLKASKKIVPIVIGGDDVARGG